MELRVSSSVSQQWFCPDDASLPSDGSRWTRFPAVISSIKALRLPASLAHRLICSPSGSVIACHDLCPPKRSREKSRPSPGPGVAQSGPPAGLLSRAITGSPRLPDIPSPDSAPLPRPRPTRVHLTDTGAPGAAPALTTTKASALCISRLNNAASSAPVYASRPALPWTMQDSVPAGELRLCRAGVEPAGML